MSLLSVSYTQLDGYKRQEDDGTITGCPKSDPQALMEAIYDMTRPSLFTEIEPVETSDGVVPVAYTHLDVYKRQRYDSARYKTQLKKNGVKLMSATEIISEGPEGIILESVLEGYAEYYSADLAEKAARKLPELSEDAQHSLTAVSYTHLFKSSQSFEESQTQRKYVTFEYYSI